MKPCLSCFDLALADLVVFGPGLKAQPLGAPVPPPQMTASKPAHAEDVAQRYPFGEKAGGPKGKPHRVQRNLPRVRLCVIRRQVIRRCRLGSDQGRHGRAPTLPCRASCLAWSGVPAWASES